MEYFDKDTKHWRTLETWAWTAALCCLTEHKGGHLSPNTDFSTNTKTGQGECLPGSQGFRPSCKLRDNNSKNNSGLKEKICSVSLILEPQTQQSSYSVQLWRRWCYQALKKEILKFFSGEERCLLGTLTPFPGWWIHSCKQILRFLPF